MVDAEEAIVLLASLMVVKGPGVAGPPSEAEARVRIYLARKLARLSEGEAAAVLKLKLEQVRGLERGELALASTRQVEDAVRELARAGEWRREQAREVENARAFPGREGLLRPSW